MFRTFETLTAEEETKNVSEISEMAQNNTTVDFTSLVNRLNALETTVREIQSKQAENEKVEENGGDLINEKPEIIDESEVLKE